MGSSTTRYTILLDEPTVETLNKLQATCGLGTRAAVFDLSLVVLDWFVKQQIAGHEVGRKLKGEGTFQPLLLPIKLRLPDDHDDEEPVDGATVNNKRPVAA